jgi:hypothetical protein
MTNRPEDRDSSRPPAGQQRPPAYDPQRRGGPQRQSVAETAIKAFVRSIAGSLGRVIMRAIVGRR